MVMSKQELEATAQAMVAKGKGILAADESMGTIKRRFDSIKIDSNENKPTGTVPPSIVTLSGVAPGHFGAAGRALRASG